MFITRKRLEKMVEDAKFEAEDKAYENFSEQKFRDRVYDLEDKVSELEEKINDLISKSV